MITHEEEAAAKRDAAELLRRAGIPATATELESIEVADFGLSRLAVEGAQILTLVATDRIAVKLLLLTPHQTLPEHWHPPVGDDPGKEETVRLVWGELSVVTEGPDTLSLATVPTGKASYYTCRHEHRLDRPVTMTFEPGAKHWFQAGPEGAVAYSFSTVARDVLDGFTDPAVERVTRIGGR
jgi:D-lyxose ketol-isomerase